MQEKSDIIPSNLKFVQEWPTQKTENTALGGK